MNVLRASLSTLAFCALPAANVSATTVSLQPSMQTIASGAMVAVELNISGLGDSTAPSLGAFLVDVTFNDTILVFDSVNYGALLGNPDDPLETNILTTVAGGSVSLDELSFLFDFELDALQPAGFTLATLNFTGVDLGTSALDFGLVDLSDAAFPANTLIPTLEPASITVATPKSSMPEPTSWLLMVTSSGVLVAWRCRRRHERLGRD